MPETVIPGPVSEDTQIREATCIHTNKIYDSCQSKDCMEDLLLYPSPGSQEVLDNAQSLKSGRAELLYVDVDVEPVGLNQGFYTVDCQYFYRITADAYTSSCGRPCRISGLATFSKRSMLFGSQGAAKTFTSDRNCPRKIKLSFEDNLPTAVVEAVDPILLSLKLVDRCDHHGGHGHKCECERKESGQTLNVPQAILDAFDEPLLLNGDQERQVRLALGQFSILRLERDSQLLIPIYDYCMPDSECDCGSSCDDPCQLFQQVDFPVNEFFPPASSDSIDPLSQLRNVGYQISGNN